MAKGGRKKRAKSPWMRHVANTMVKMPGVALKEVLRAASKTYKKVKVVPEAVTARVLKLKRKKRRRTRRVRKRTRRRVRRRVRRRRRSSRR